MSQPASTPDTPEATQPIRIMIVDDHPVVREGIAALIERRPDMTVIVQAGNGSDAVRLYRTHRPDVTLMDLRLPEMDGVAAIETIRKEFPAASFLVLTTYDGDEDIHRALRAGAMGYLLKDAPRDHLMEAIRAVRAGEMCLPKDIGAKLARRLTVQDISVREKEVLRLVAQGKSNQEVGRLLSITEGTVKLHVNSIMTKLGASDRTHAVTTALKRGILHLE